MKTHGTLSPLGQMVRRVDPDRYLTALFAPPARRETLFTLYAFNHELARAREVVREPFAALIRLQWWREVIEGARRAHDVAGPLGHALDAGWLKPDDLEAMITAREMEADGFETLADFEAYVMGAAGGVMVAAGHALGWQEADALRPWGAAYGVAGVLKNAASHARQDRCLLPQDLVRAAGSSPAAAIADPATPALDSVRAKLRATAQAWLTTKIDTPSTAMAAALPMVLAHQDLQRPNTPLARPLSDKLRVIMAGLTRSVRHRPPVR